jgi:hypothetical protein
MRPRAARWPALLGVVVLLIGCGLGPSAAGTRYLDLPEAGFRLPIPDGWGAAAVRGATADQARLLAVLSSEGLPDGCQGGADASGCAVAISTLSGGALVAWWTTRNCAGTACELPVGERLLIGGREATRQSGTSLCSSLGSTDEVAYLVQVSPQRIDTIISCARDAAPSVRTALLDALAGVDWRTP